MIQSVDDRYPEIPHSAYVHPTAVVIGDVVLGEHASVWPNAVLRGDGRQIVIGAFSNVQDGCMVHTGKYKTVVHEHVVIGHNATLHSCEIGPRCLIGMGAVIMDGAEVGEGCIIGAGTVIPSGKVIPPRSVAVGNPYQITRKTTDDDIAYILSRCEKYVRVAKMYKRTGNIL